MYLNLIGALIFSFVFFGIWSLKDACNAAASAAIKPTLIGLIFILAAFIITRF